MSVAINGYVLFKRATEEPLLVEVAGGEEEVDDPKASFDAVGVMIGDENERVWVGARATPAIPEVVKLGMEEGALSIIATANALVRKRLSNQMPIPGKFEFAALIALANRSLAFDGMVDTSPIRGGSSEGLVRLP